MDEATMSVDLSFLMVTNRDWETHGRIVVESLYRTNSPYDYEILVYSPFPVEGPKILWVEDTTKDGCVSGFNELLKYNPGRYVVPAVDDMVYDNSIFKAIPFLESELFANRKYKICAVCAGIIPGESLIPSPSRPTNFGFAPYIKENNFRVVGYPFMSIETIGLLGGIMFPPCFKHHYGDNWLAYYLGRLGEEVLECLNTPMYGFGDTTEYKYDEHDFGVFCDLVKRFELENYTNYS